jgi:hypothetical protein
MANHSEAAHLSKKILFVFLLFLCVIGIGGEAGQAFAEESPTTNPSVSNPGYLGLTSVAQSGQPKLRTYCFAYSGPTTMESGFGSLFASTVVGVNVMQLPAGDFESWFRAAPSLATVASLTNGQPVCVSGPVDSLVFA